MASIGIDKGGGKRILFYAPDGRRKTIRIGKCSMRDAEMFQRRIENLLSAKVQGKEPSRDDASWLDGLGDNLRKRIEAAGLAEASSKQKMPSLQQWIDGYIARRGDVKSGTVITYNNARRNLLKFFGGSRPLDSITSQDAYDFRAYLLSSKDNKGQGLSENTVRKRCSISKQFFTAAKRKRLILDNPFDGIPCSVQENPEKFFYVTNEISQAILDACPDDEWRLLFGLCRWGGLRCPSEIVVLKWEDVIWDKGYFVVHASKTERYANKGIRKVPIFAELRPLLEAVFKTAKRGAKYCITRYRRSNQNLRTQLGRICKRAGVEQWPNLFQNLRSSRETELFRELPGQLKDVCKIIGNSPQVAMKHYAQAMDDIAFIEFCKKSGTKRGTAGA